MGMRQQIESWYPVVLAIIESQHPKQATDSILALVPHMTPTDLPAAPQPAPAPAAPTAVRRRASPAPSAAATPPSEGPRMMADGQLFPDHFYTVEEAAKYVGVQTNTIYTVIRDQPGRVVFTRDGTGRSKYRLRGRELNTWKKQRQHGRAEVLDTDDEDGQDGDEERAEQDAGAES